MYFVQLTRSENPLDFAVWQWYIISRTTVTAVVTNTVQRGNIGRR